MAVYCKITNGQATRDTIGELRRDNPQTSFPDKVSPSLLADFDVFNMVDGPRPDLAFGERLERGPIEQQGDEWVQTWNTVFIYDTDVEYRAAWESAVRDEAARRLDLAANGYRQKEIDSWPEQISEAEAVMLGRPVSKLLDPMAKSRGVTLRELAYVILQKRDEHSETAGAILAAQEMLIKGGPGPDLSDDANWVT
jgi:hypothetical protein